MAQDLKKLGEKFLRTAKENGLGDNYLFLTTFKRYQMQLEILDNLEVSIKEHGMQVTKEYVKGRGNLYSNPAIADYNRTTDSANKTVAAIMRIFKQYGVDDGANDDDPLMSVINGGDDGE